MIKRTSLITPELIINGIENVTFGTKSIGRDLHPIGSKRKTNDRGEAIPKTVS